MRKPLFTTILLLAVCMSMMAVPAKRGVYKILKLDDGREIRAMLVGDEYGSFWKGDNGQAYVLRGDRYAAVDEKTIVEKANARRAKANTRNASRLLKARGFGDSHAYYGKKKSIIILVNFADIAFQEGHDSVLVQRIMNEENFREDPFVGSVYDYFRDQSTGLFHLNFDVLGPVTISKERKYYGRDGDSDEALDAPAAEMVIEAVNQVKDIVEDWHQYDWDGNGEVDQVFLIFAGNGEADTGIVEAVWPHQSDLYSANYYGYGTGPVKVDDNLVVNTYACSAELNGNNSIFGIGTMCHEFSHCLGLPDFYDTTYSGGQGMQDWDLMHGGNYNGDSYCPAGYTSYERWLLGWQAPIVLEENDTTITDMNPLQEGGESYVIYNKGNRNEYFLLENHQFQKWDAFLPGQGLLIIHVDHDSLAWYENTVNDDYYHQRMTWVPADGVYDVSYSSDDNIYYSRYGLRTDPFPQDSVSAFNRSFKTFDSQARRAARLFNPNIDGTYYIDSSVENITQNADGTISFNFVADYSGEEPDEPSTRIKSVTTAAPSGPWYMLDGRRLQGRPAKKGLYIRNNRKEFVQ